MPKKKEEAAPKKKGEQAPTRAQAAADLVESFNKQYKGRAEISLASDLDLPYLTKRLPTGLLSLDVALGGGFPAAGISQIIGPKNSGKSYIVWQMVRQLQAILGEDMYVLFAMTEMRADRSQGRKAGVAVAYSNADIASFERARTQSGLAKFTKDEIGALRFEVGHIHELHGMSAEELYDGVLAAVDKNVYQLIIIDSIGNIMSGAEAEAESLSQQTYGGAAQVNTKFLHKLTSMFGMRNEYGKTRDTCVMGINQIRDAIGDPHAEYKSPGGKALEHAKFVDLWVSSGAKIGGYENVFGPQGSNKEWNYSAKEVNWEIKKGKAGIREGLRGKYIYSFETNAADFYTDAMVAAARAGIVEQRGTYLVIVDPDTGKELLNVQGREKFIKALHDDVVAHGEDPEKSILHYLRIQTLRKHDILIDYDWT